MGEEAGEAGGVAGFEIPGGFDSGEEAEGGPHRGRGGGVVNWLWELEQATMILKLQRNAFCNVRPAGVVGGRISTPVC